MTRQVVLVSGAGPPLVDGVKDYTQNLVRELAARRPEWRWYWLCRRARWFHAPVRFLEGPVTLLRPAHAWSGFGTVAARAALRAVRPDIVHIQDQTHSYFQSDAPVALASATGARVVSTLHEFHHELESVATTIELVRRSDVVIASDARTAIRCRESTGRVPEHQWWSPSNFRPPEAGWGVRGEPGLLTTFGFLSGLKMLDLAYHAIARLRDEGLDLRWQLVGPFAPDRDPDHARLRRSLAAPWVTFTGSMPSPEEQRLRSALGRSQVVLLPFADGASVRRTTLQTAWAFGLPVITTPPPVDEPAIRDGENCVLVTEPTAKAWADAIRRLLADPELQERLRRGSTATATEMSWKRLAGLHLQVYDRVLTG